MKVRNASTIPAADDANAGPQPYRARSHATPNGARNAPMLMPM
ncbi:MAG: hypothetical protein AAB284_07675 [Chloroflexota bacterium]